MGDLLSCPEYEEPVCPSKTVTETVSVDCSKCQHRTCWFQDPQTKVFEDAKMEYDSCKSKDSCYGGSGTDMSGCYKWTIAKDDAFTGWVSADFKTSDDAYTRSLLRPRG